LTDVAAQLELFLRERHLDAMMQIASDLGDDLVNVTPPLPEANSAYQIVWHCCGMLEWWTRSVVLGKYVDRDRDAEFVAHGTVAELSTRVQAVGDQLSRDLRAVDLDAPPRGDAGHYAGTLVAADARGALFHVFEELAQHHGQLELTRDLLTSSRVRPAATGDRRPRG
jgi:hypothetical protein